MSIAAFDPGLEGALAIFAPEHTALSKWHVYDTPTLGEAKKRIVDANSIASLLKLHDVHHAWVEEVHAMPKQGVASSFRFGMSYGAILAILGAMSIPYSTVTPRQWKKQMGLSSDKDHARRKAVELIPAMSTCLQRKKDHNRAEALLLTQWAYRYGQ